MKRQLSNRQVMKRLACTATAASLMTAGALAGVGPAASSAASSRASATPASAQNCSNGHFQVNAPGGKLYIRTGPGTNYPVRSSNPQYLNNGEDFVASCTGTGWLDLTPDGLPGDYVNASDTIGL